MKTIKTILATLALAALGVPLMALTSAASVDIPFDFQADGKNYAAGKYRIEQSETHGSVLVLRSAEGKAQFLPTSPAGNPNRIEPARMEFRKVGGEHILTAVYMPGQTGQNLNVKKLPSGERIALALAR